MIFADGASMVPGFGRKAGEEEKQKQTLEEKRRNCSSCMSMPLKRDGGFWSQWKLVDVQKDGAVDMLLICVHFLLEVEAVDGDVYSTNGATNNRSPTKKPSGKSVSVATAHGHTT